MNRPLLRYLLALVLAAASCSVGATNYVFPSGPLPAGCSGSAGTYSCGALTLGNTDTVTIASPLPATIAVNGNLSVGSATINAAGLPSDLTVTVTGSLTVGNAGRINGTVSAASMTNAAGRANIGGLLSTTGALSLGSSATVAQCVQSTSGAAITLGNSATTGGVCCGFLGSCSSSCVVNNSGSAMPAVCNTPPSASTPGRFNAFDTATAAASVSGMIHTKLAGSAFSVAVVAVNTTGTAVASGFTGSVKVELLDSSNNSGALAGSSGCRSSWVVAAGTTSSTLALASSDQGRKNINLTVANVWRDARLRISYPATGTPTLVGCSSDNFAIRPASFAGFTATDADLQNAGTTRVLNTTALTGGRVHKAGYPFNLRATVSPASATNYTATPLAVISPCSAGPACTATLGTLTHSLSNTGGVIATSTASYTEAGTFSLQLLDSTFASVDAADGSTAAEINIASSTLNVGRFVPDRFSIVTRIGSGTPTFRTFNSSCTQPRSFTYFGQPFGYVTPPEATVTALNAAGVPMSNYPNAKLAGLTRSQAYSPSPTATPGLQVRDIAGGNAILPTITPHGNGTATLATQASDVFTMLRPSVPLDPYVAAIGVTWSVADTSEAGTSGNGTNTSIASANYAITNIAFDGTPPTANEFRFGVLTLSSAYGSELLNLAVPLELRYWNGSSFITNAEDQCTTLAASSVALGPYRGSLAACETAPGSASLTFTNGRALLRMLAAGAGNAGSVDATINLGLVAAGSQCSAVGAPATPALTANMPWLQRKGPTGVNYNLNPAARISFGQHRSPLIHLREVY